MKKPQLLLFTNLFVCTQNIIQRRHWRITERTSCQQNAELPIWNLHSCRFSHTCELAPHSLRCLKLEDIHRRCWGFCKATNSWSDQHSANFDEPSRRELRIIEALKWILNTTTLASLTVIFLFTHDDLAHQKYSKSLKNFRHSWTVLLLDALTKLQWTKFLNKC